MSNVVLAILVVLAEMFLHYFPWRLVLRGHELPRLLAYGFGVLGLMVPFTAWLLERDYDKVAIMLWVVLSAGGLAVGLCWLFDWAINRIWKERERKALENLKRKRNGKSKRT